MKAFSITYDLKVPGRNYEGLYNAIKSCGKYWHYLDSTWIVVSNESSQQVWNMLAPNIDKSDFVLVIEVRRDCYGWLPKDAWDWINANVPL